jgi:hypothetical protein
MQVHFGMTDERLSGQPVRHVAPVPGHRRHSGPHPGVANKILLADNIGTMADRILVTQQLQNTNIALTQASILTTQQNMVALSRTFNTFAYNSGLAGLVSQGNALSSQMGAVTLGRSTMNTQLASVAASVTAYLNSVIVLYTQMSSDSAVAASASAATR